MKLKVNVIALRALVLFVSILIPNGLTAKTQGVEDFPGSVKFVGKNLVSLTASENEALNLVGRSKRSFLFFDVYEVAYYKSWSTSLTAVSELIWIKYQRSLSKNRIRKAILEGLEINTSDDVSFLVKKFFQENLAEKIRDVSDGDELLLYSDPDVGVKVFINGEPVAVLDNAAFNKALFSIWLGSKSVVNRKEILGLAE